MLRLIICGTLLMGSAAFSRAEDPPEASVEITLESLDALTQQLEKELVSQRPRPGEVPLLEDLEKALSSELDRVSVPNVPVPPDVAEDIGIYKQLLEAELASLDSAWLQQQRHLKATGEYLLPPLSASLREDIERYRSLMEAELFPPPEEDPPAAELEFSEPVEPAEEVPPEKDPVKKKADKPLEVKQPDAQDPVADPKEVLEERLKAQSMQLIQQVAYLNARFRQYEKRMAQLEMELEEQLQQKMDDRLALIEDNIMDRLAVVERERTRLTREREAGLKLVTMREKQIRESLEEALDEFKVTLYREIDAIRKRDSKEKNTRHANLSELMDSRDKAARKELDAFKDSLLADLQQYTQSELDTRLQEVDRLLHAIAETREHEAKAARRVLDRIRVSESSGVDQVPEAELER